MSIVKTWLLFWILVTESELIAVSQILVELSKYTHDPVNNDETVVFYSAEHRGHANAQGACTQVPVSRPLALKFKPGLFPGTMANDARAQSRRVAVWMLIGATPAAGFDSAAAPDAQARSHYEVIA
jgi:hypothetical protein